MPPDGAHERPRYHASTVDTCDGLRTELFHLLSANISRNVVQNRPMVNCAKRFVEIGVFS